MVTTRNQYTPKRGQSGSLVGNLSDTYFPKWNDPLGQLEDSVLRQSEGELYAGGIINTVGIRTGNLLTIPTYSTPVLSSGEWALVMTSAGFTGELPSGSVVGVLDDLEDVDTTTNPLIANQVLTYNGTEWTNRVLQSSQILTALGYNPWYAGNHPTTLTGYGILETDTLFNGRYADIEHSHSEYLGISASAISAAKLETVRTLWGQNFNGTANVTGSLTDVLDIYSTGIISSSKSTTGTLIIPTTPPNLGSGEWGLVMTSSGYTGELPSGSGAQYLDELEDVDLTQTPLALNQVLLYSGTDWINSTLGIPQITNLSTELLNRYTKTQSDARYPVLVSGIIPAGYLPSYVDDIIEVATFSALPVTGESGKIYVTLDTNLTYRWGGTEYTEVSKSLALGETSETAYRGDRGKIAYDHSQIVSGNPHGVSYSNILGTVPFYTKGESDLRYHPMSGSSDISFTAKKLKSSTLVIPTGPADLVAGEWGLVMTGAGFTGELPSGSGVQSLDDLSDVTIAAGTLTTGQTILYDGVDFKNTTLTFGYISGSLDASRILTNATRRFVTDSQISTWNSKQDAIAFVTNTEGKFLRDDNTFQVMEPPVGGFANNLYFSEVASDIPGYKTLSYTPDTAETLYSISTIGSDTLPIEVGGGTGKVVETFLYPGEVSVDLFPSGVWSFAFYGNVSSLVGITQIGIQYFRRSTTGVETNLFTTWSHDIGNTTADYIKFDTTNPIYPLDPTDRMGARILVRTDHASPITVTFSIGDGYAAYLNNPNKIRHSQLRALNGDPNFLHITQSEKGHFFDAYSGSITSLGLTTTTLTLTKRDASTLTANIPTWNQDTTGNAATATTLKTSRTLWGQSFNGSANVTGSLSSVGDITMTGSITGSVNITASGRLKSGTLIIPTGTTNLVAGEWGLVMTGAGFTGELPGEGGATSLDGLSDVTLGTLATSQILTYNGTVWVNALLSSNQVVTALGYTPQTRLIGTQDTSNGSLVRTNTAGTIYYDNTSYATVSQLSGYALASHNHDDRYYTETEVANFFSGTVAISGYNKSNWDTAFSWGNHLGLYFPRRGIAARVDANTAPDGIVTEYRFDNTPLDTISTLKTVVYSPDWIAQEFTSMVSDRKWLRRRYNGTTWSAWQEFIHTGNYSSYALPLSGGVLTTSGVSPLAVNSTHATANEIDIYFRLSGVNKGAIGFYGGWASPSMYMQDLVNGHTLRISQDGNARVNDNIVIHSGNIGSYASPVSGSANYIQNQNSSAQSANIWIDGLLRINHGNGVSVQLNAAAGTFNTFAFAADGANRGYIQWNIDEGATGSAGTAMHVRNAQGNLYLWDSSNSGLKISSGAATFSSTVSATSFTSGGNAVLHAGNYSSYALPLSGGTISGSLNVSSSVLVEHNSGIIGSSAGYYMNHGLEIRTNSNHVPTLSFHRNGYSATALYEYDGELYVNPWTTRPQAGRLLSSGNYSSYALPLSGGTLSGNVSFTTLSTPNYNTAVLQGNWNGAGYWGLGSDGIHTIKIDQINGLGSTQAFIGATDIVLKLGTKTVIDSGNYSSYALPLSGGTMNDTKTINWNHNVVSWDDGTSGFRCISNLNETYSYHAGFSFKGYYGLQLRTYGGGDTFTIRGHNASNWGAWREVIHSGNYSSYALPLSGGGLTGMLYMSGANYLSLVGLNYNNIATITGNWGGSNHWGFGSESGHILKFDVVSGQTFLGYSDVTLKLGINTVYHTGNLTNTLSNGYLPYWNVNTGRLEDSAIVQKTDGSGNVGVSNSNPQRRLHINSSSSPALRLENAGSNQGIEMLTQTGKYSWLLGAQYNIDGGFEITPSTEVGGSTFSTPVAVFKANGNVGIGTTTPNAKLDVLNTATDSGIIANFIRRIDAINEFAYIKVGNSAPAFFGNLLAPYDMAYMSAVADPSTGNGIFVNTLGNVGIGYTTDQGYRLAVNGAGYFSNGLIVPENRVAFDFRPTAASYRTSIVYETAGNEALSFVTTQSVTSFMFVNGSDPAIWSGGQWTVTTPSLQIKQNSVYVNTLIPNGVTPTYKFYVTGSTYLDGVVYTASGTKVGSNTFGANSGYAEIQSAGNEICIGGSTQMYVNYRAASGGTPTTWYWMKSGGAYANFSLGYLRAYYGIYSDSYIESASYLKGTSVKIGSSWEAIPNGNDLELRYGGVMKAKLSSSGDILAVGGVTAFAV